MKKLSNTFAGIPRRESILQTGIQNLPLNFSLPQHRNRWRDDQNCISCYRSLGLGLRRAKKYFCKFCYRAVCAECSKMRAEHPQTAQKERICDECQSRATEKQFQQGYSDQLTRVIQEKYQIQTEIMKQIQKKKEIGSQSNQIQEKIKFLKDQQEKFDKLQQMINSLESKRESLIRINKGINFQLEEIDETDQSMKLGIEESQEKIKVQEEKDLNRRQQISQLRKELDQLQNQKFRMMSFIEESHTQGQTGFERDKQTRMTRQAFQLKEENEELEYEQGKMKKKIDQLQEQIKELRNQRKKVKEELSYVNKNPANQLLSHQERLKMFEYISKIESQQKQIKILKKRKELQDDQKAKKAHELNIV